jgi:hypothetical protein
LNEIKAAKTLKRHQTLMLKSFAYPIYTTLRNLEFIVDHRAQDKTRLENIY